MGSNLILVSNWARSTSRPSSKARSSARPECRIPTPGVLSAAMRGIEIEVTIPGTGRRITLPRVEPGNAAAAASPLDHWAARGDVDQQAEAMASALLADSDEGARAFRDDGALSTTWLTEVREDEQRLFGRTVSPERKPAMPKRFCKSISMS